MIRVYTQYSYGGYKIFPIECKAKELLDSNVKSNNLYGFPLECDVFFSYGGVKLIYKEISDHQYALVIKEIPSAHKDSSGRHIPCAVLFVGQSDEKCLMDKLAVRITANICEFESFFQSLFYDRGDLFVHGDQLFNFIVESNNISFEKSSLNKVLNGISFETNPVKLFVPLSPYFGVDDLVTKRTLDELNLGEYEELRNVVIKPSELGRLQLLNNLYFDNTDKEESEKVDETNQFSENITGSENNIQSNVTLSKEVEIALKPKVEDDYADEIECFSEKISLLSKELAQEKENNLELTTEKCRLTEQLNLSKNQNTSLSQKLKCYKNIIYALLVIILFLLLTRSCSN